MKINYWSGNSATTIALARVTRYNLKGWMEDLPQLNIGRRYHACAGFQSEADKRVRYTGGIRTRPYIKIFVIFLLFEQFEELLRKFFFI